ncbi:MAG: PIG-L deacetylase family protein [Gemmataceae bacterium]
MSSQTKVALSILAHPDDAEFLCAGTLLRLKLEHGWDIHIVTMTPGDCGSAELPPEEISRVRRGEGRAGAQLIEGTYHCVEESDLLVFYDKTTIQKVTRMVRTIRPTILFTHSPVDYMLDHEMTSRLTRAAAFNAPIPNFAQDPALPPLGAIPHLYYCDPVEGKDSFGNEVVPQFLVDISGVIEKKAEMLMAHSSQRDWLFKHHGMDQYVTSMKEWGATRGQSIGVSFAEGFRQHLGHGYPQNNLLAEVLGSRQA